MFSGSAPGGLASDHNLRRAAPTRRVPCEEGEACVTTKEMMRTSHRPGYWFVNVAPLGEAPNWEEQVAPVVEDESRLFGYDRDEFMQKQYRRRA